MRAIIHTFDTTVTKLIIGLPAALKPFFMAITMLGDPIVTIGIGLVIVIYGFLQQNLKLAVAGGAVWVTLAVGAILKFLFARARPVNDYAVNLRIDTFSFPSGHSSGSIIAYGLLAYMAYHLLPAPWNIIVCLALCIVPLLVGISRVYLGVHYPSDVLAGWLLGAAMLAFVIFVLHPLGAR